MSMIQESLLQYLLWLRERGQCWPSKYQELLAEVSDDPSESCSLQPTDETNSSVTDVSLEADVSSRDLSVKSLESADDSPQKPCYESPEPVTVSEPSQSGSAAENDEPCSSELPEQSDVKPQNVKGSSHITTDQIHPEPEPQAPKLQTGILRTAGNKKAPVIFVTDSIYSQPLVFGWERDLLLKILSAVGLRPGQDMLLATLDTNELCEPLTERKDYRQVWNEFMTEVKPEFVLIFGSLAYHLISSGSYEDYLKHRNTWINSRSAQVRYLVLPHLSEFVNQTHLKKMSWPALQELKSWILESRL